ELTEADRRALELYAAVEERVPDQSVVIELPGLGSETRLTDGWPPSGTSGSGGAVAVPLEQGEAQGGQRWGQQSGYLHLAETEPDGDLRLGQLVLEAQADQHLLPFRELSDQGVEREPVVDLAHPEVTDAELGPPPVLAVTVARGVDAVEVERAAHLLGLDH